MEQIYYVSHKHKLLKGLDDFAGLLRPELIARYGEQAATQIHQDTLAEYERLIPQLPYVGGQANPLTSNLVEAGCALALYRVLRAHGGTVEEAGELSHLAVERRLRRIPAPLRRFIGRLKFARWRVRRMKRRARLSQQRRYPGDWVWEVIEGDGRTFDVGIDYTECGIDKFMRSQGAEELTPYLCNTDYVLFGAIGMELVRARTLAWGCDRCDFRIKLRGTPPAAWPPAFVERHCGSRGADVRFGFICSGDALVLKGGRAEAFYRTCNVDHAVTERSVRKPAALTRVTVSCPAHTGSTRAVEAAPAPWRT